MDIIEKVEESLNDEGNELNEIPEIQPKNEEVEKQKVKTKYSVLKSPNFTL